MADPIFIENFDANPGREGPQIILSWTYPVNFEYFVDELSIRRKVGTFPTSVTDGKEIFSTTTFEETTLADLDVKREVCFYYTAFSKKISDGLFTFDSTTQTESMTYDTGFFERALYDKLPGFWKVSDSNPAIVDQTKLTEDTVLITDSGLRAGQKLNFQEPLDKKGFVRRIFKTIGVEFDRLEETIEFFPTFFDLDETCSDFLPLIADLIGVTTNFDFTVARRREEIRNAVSRYKIKGTQPMLVSLITGLTGGIVPQIALWRNNVLVTNDVNSTFFSFETEDVTKQYLADDPNDYIVSDEPLGYNFNKIAVFLDVTGKEISQTVVNKLNRTIPDFVPARIDVLLIFFDSVSETFDVVNVTESTTEGVSVGDTFDAVNVIETTGEEVETLYLITNDPNKVTNNLGWLTATTPS